MEKSTISMAIFNSFLYVYQRLQKNASEMPQILLRLIHQQSLLIFCQMITWDIAILAPA